jgi:L-lactate utilization protein LutB
VQPHLKGLREAGFLSELTTLSGEDTANCPVNIPFNKLLFSIRKKNIRKNPSGSRKMFFYLWKKVMLNNDRSSWKNHKAHRYYVNQLFLRSAQGLRDMRPLPKESFNDSFRKKFR